MYLWEARSFEDRLYDCGGCRAICLIKHPIFSMVEQVVTSANDDALLGA